MYSRTPGIVKFEMSKEDSLEKRRSRFSASMDGTYSEFSLRTLKPGDHGKEILPKVSNSHPSDKCGTVNFDEAVDIPSTAKKGKKRSRTSQNEIHPLKEAEAISKRCRRNCRGLPHEDGHAKTKPGDDSDDESQIEDFCKDKAKPKSIKDQSNHVKVTRRQATETHRISERNRREKIRERMRFLQDLVPGCNEATSKAVLLDKLINYVRSLQNQVQFLSIRLAGASLSRKFGPEIDYNLLGNTPILHESEGTNNMVLGCNVNFPSDIKFQTSMDDCSSQCVCQWVDACSLSLGERMQTIAYAPIHFQIGHSDSRYSRDMGMDLYY